MYEIFTNSPLFPVGNNLKQLQESMSHYLGELHNNLSDKIEYPDVVSIIEGCLSLNNHSPIEKILEQLNNLISVKEDRIIFQEEVIAKKIDDAFKKKDTKKVSNI